MVNKLQEVRATRALFRELTRAIITDALAPYAAQGMLAEVGAGDGQLIDLLPTDLQAKVVHTEPLALGVNKLRAAFPQANVQRASAEALPFADAEVDAILALCVFDVLKDGPGAAAEFARVLKPGGRVIHFLDMSADPVAALLQVQAARLMIYPNVFSDPCETEWPEDMFVAPIREMERIVDILQRASHPSARALRKYLALFQAMPFSASRAAGAYTELLEDGQAKLALLEILRTASKLAVPEERAEIARFQGQPVSSAKHLEGRLRQWFCAETGFEVETSAMHTRSCLTARHSLGTIKDSTRYLSIAAGHVRELGALPEHLLSDHTSLTDADQSTESAWGRDGSSALGEKDAVLLEQSIFVFVAHRI